MKNDRLNKVFNNIDDCPKECPIKKPSRIIDIKGQTYNHLEVLYYVGSKNKRSEWLCKCNNCGKYVVVDSHNLRSGHTKSCGCLISEKLRKDKVGKQYGYLKVLKYDCSKNESPYYIVECKNCGRVYSANGYAIEKQYSCGCISSKSSDVIFKTLKSSKIKYISNVTREKTFDDCIFKNKLKFDFYIKNNMGDDILIEYDGQQHEKPIKFNSKKSETDMYKDFISQQVRDWYKDYYCITNNKKLIRIKSTDKKNPTYNDIYNNSYIVGKPQCLDKIIDVMSLNEADTVNNKNITFTIMSGISCTFKCCKNNPCLCQNYETRNYKSVKCNIDDLIERYEKQDISHSITFQGSLEVLDNLKQLLWFIYYFRKKHNDDIYIWTGYTEEECEDLIYLIKEKMQFPNIIIKFGRFIPNQKPHYDEVLGVNLISDNQYAKRIS